MKITSKGKTTRRNRAFSLVELLTVILIIAVLVALIVGVAGFAETKAAQEKAKTQLAFIKSTLSTYKNAYGEWPQSGEGSYEGDAGARILYQVLTGDGDDRLGGNSASNGRIDEDEKELDYKPPLDPAHDRHGFIRKQPNGEIEPILLDPFGNPWNYRPYEEESDTKTRNQTYDVWSYGNDSGRQVEAKWITNWSG